MPHTMAHDKVAKARGESYRYHVEAHDTLDAAKQLVDYLTPRVDSERWEFEAVYSRAGTEPPWDRREVREQANTPPDGVDMADVTPTPGRPISITAEG